MRLLAAGPVRVVLADPEHQHRFFKARDSS